MAITIQPTDLSALTPITTAAGALSSLVLVSPQTTIGYQPTPIDAQGIITQRPPALLFHYEGEQTVALESDITDHYIEDNTAIQDQIALKPEIITTHGFIGELNDVPPAALAVLQAAAQKLTSVTAYQPSLSATALLAYQDAFSLYQTGANAVNSAVSSWSSITGGGGENVVGSQGLETGAFNASTGNISNNQTKQQVAFQQFYGYWRARTLFTVQTPWAVFQNMAIRSLRAIQDAETRMITDFEVSFKMMRFASTQTTQGIAPILQGRAALQNAGLTDLGTSAAQTSSVSQTAALATMGVA